MMGIRDAYQVASKQSSLGVQGYHVENKYFDPKKQGFGKDKSETKVRTKKGSYIDDYIKLHRQIPGPGVYEFSLRGSAYVKTKNIHTHISDKKTFIDQIIDREKKQKGPAPGQYEPKTKKKRPNSAAVSTSRVPTVTQRTTYLDAAQYCGTQSPGVGLYNARPQSAQPARKDKMKPQDWRVKHQLRPKSAKQAQVGTYNPIMIGKKDFSKRTKSTHNWGGIDRFKDLKGYDNIGPGKYQGHVQWGNKANKRSQSKANASSVYYN